MYDLNSSVLHFRAPIQVYETLVSTNLIDMEKSVEKWDTDLAGRYFRDSENDNDLICVVKVKHNIYAVNL
jgi:hypothetical protein